MGVYKILAFQALKLNRRILKAIKERRYIKACYYHGLHYKRLSILMLEWAEEEGRNVRVSAYH